MRVETAPLSPQLEKSLGRQESGHRSPDGASEVSAGPLTGTGALLHLVIPEGATATTAAIHIQMHMAVSILFDTPLIQSC